MKSFSYRALNKEGKEVRGVLSAVNQTEAIRLIRRIYPVLLTVKEQDTKRSFRSLFELELGKRRFSAKTLSILCSQITIMLHSGMTISRAVHILSEQITDKRLKFIMNEAARRVDAGSTIADALEEFQEFLPLIFIETIRMGEESGTLESSFEHLAHFYEKSYQVSEKIKAALAYPVFVLIVAVFVLVFIMTKVIPTIASVFQDLGGQLPALTRYFLAVSDFLVSKWMFLVPFLFFVLLFFLFYEKTPGGQIWMAKCQLSVPVLGTIFRMNAVIQFAGTLSVLMKNGIVLDRAVYTASKTIDNAIFQKEIRSIKNELEQGRSLSECLRKTTCFPAAVTDMCAVGEESGDLERALEHIAAYYTNEADYRMKRLLVLLEPALLLLLALFAGIIVFSVYLPVFSMYELI